jgi:vacuolar-type H+-ATPase subunit F/Vma7
VAEFLIIAGPDAAPGFRLGGFDCIEVEEGEDISSIIEGIEKEGRYGLVCIEERFLRGVSGDIMRSIKKRGLPVIVPISIPGAWTEGEPEESPIARLIRRAIGYHIKLKK